MTSEHTTSEHKPWLAHLNALPDEIAEAELMACCASTRWAREVATKRPYADGDALLAAGRESSAGLDWTDVLQALSAHPAIGERPTAAKTGGEREAGWSRSEQSGMDAADEWIRDDLAAANREYADRFGHVFLICASGLSAERMLAAVRYRLGNDEAEEQRIVTNELGKIAALRLERLLGS
jgi:2-oxo-4-hydroxy-4-carboxy-5-ureidoimidazoline decarboxylase